MLFFQYFLYQRLKLSKIDAKLKFAIAYTIQAITGNVYDLAVIIDPYSAIVGKSAYVTVMVGVSYGTAYGGSVIFFEAILHLLIGMKSITSVKSKLLIKNSANTFSRRSKVLYIMCFLFSLTPLIGLFVPEEMCYISGILNFSCWNIFHIFFAISFNPPINVVRRELLEVISRSNDLESTSIDVASIEVLRKNFLIAQLCVNGLFSFTFIVYLLFSCWDILIRRSVFVTLYCTIGVHVISFPMLFALSYNKSNDSKKVIPLMTSLSGSVPISLTPVTTSEEARINPTRNFNESN